MPAVKVFPDAIHPTPPYNKSVKNLLVYS